MSEKEPIEKPQVDCGFYPISSKYIISYDSRVPQAMALTLESRLLNPLKPFPKMKVFGEDGDTSSITHKSDSVDRFFTYADFPVAMWGESNDLTTPNKFSKGFSVEVYPQDHWDIKIAPTVDEETQEILDSIMASIDEDDAPDFWSEVMRVWPKGKIGKNDEIEFTNGEVFLDFISGEFSHYYIDISGDGDPEVFGELQWFEDERSMWGEAVVPITSILPLDPEENDNYVVTMGLKIGWTLDEDDQDAEVEYADDEASSKYKEMCDYFERLINNQQSGVLNVQNVQLEEEVITEEAIKKYIEPYIKIRRKELEMV